MVDISELFQEHIAEFLIREHGFAVLTQDGITDPEFMRLDESGYLRAASAQPS